MNSNKDIINCFQNCFKVNHKSDKMNSERIGKVFKGFTMITVIVFSMILSTVLVSPVESTHIRINENGGYEEIVVSIGKEVPPIACQQLIQNIQGILTTSSDYLRRATDGRVFFQRVVIVVPSNWDSLACGRSLPVNSFTSRSRVNDAAIRIGADHPVFGSFPWTQQSRGCGLPGDYISVGYNYILQFNETENVIGGSTGTISGGHGGGAAGSDENDGNDSENGYGTNRGYSYGSNAPVNSNGAPTERVFVKEWAKFRYGVFEEIGFINDAIYPVAYKEAGERKPTSCTNSPLRGTWSSGCDESSWVENKTCIFTPATETGSGSGSSTSKGSLENDRITSSIMSFQEMKNVKLFCDQSTHNAKAPTKQNFLCEGKSTSEVIYAHPDFKNLAYREPNVPVPPPEFIVKQITTPRFVLLVEETGNMNLRDVWKFLKLAVRKFIKYDLPTGTQIGLISVSTSDVKVLSNMTSLQTLTLRRALADKLPNYPNIDSGGNISLRRGIFQAVEMLKRNQQRAAGSVIILVSQGTVSSPDLEASLELLRTEEVTIAAIEYPSLGDGKISLLAEGTNGPHFTIRETGVGPMTHLSTFVQLINALMAIQRFFTEELAPTWPVMIHQAEYKGDSRSYIEANFSFESSAAQTPAEFFIYTSNPNDPKINSVELTSPNGVKYTTQLSDLHDINVIKIDAVINEPGVWRYRIERLADSHQSHFIQVMTKTSSSEDLTATLYTNVEMDRVANLSSTPLILYVEVKHKKNSPVIDADVEAHIIAGNKKWTVRLLDNGNGDADITAGDGVYSRYFIVPSGVTATQLDISARIVVNPYRARFIVATQPNSSPTGRSNLGEQPCCGSRLLPSDPKQQYKIVPFGERTSNSLKIRISEIPVLGFYTPGRIGDLRMAGLNLATRNLTLTWTAPGEDYDQGVSASYQIFYSPDRVNENWAILAEMKADLEAGVEDNVTVTLPQYGSFLVAIRAVDFYLKPGKMSNIVKVTVTPPPKEPEHSYSSSSGTGSGNGGNTLSIKNTTPSPTKDFSRFDLMLIILCGAAFVFLLAGMIVMLLYCKRSSISQRKSSKNPADTKISAITDPKSPIHWSASELLGEHEKRHSLYGGSVSPKSDQNLKGGHTEMQLTQNQINQHNVPNGHHHHPMHLNIMPSEYGGTNSSTRSRSSPDSYDDPDSPTPIPVSVRHTVRPTGAGDYTICVDGSSRHNESNVGVSGYGYPPQIHHHHHPNNTPHHHQYPHHQHYQIPQNGGLVVTTPGGGPAYPSGNPRFSTAVNTSSPLPPPPVQNASSHLMHYDPEIQGSMNSVNSKKRNITMV